MLENNAHKNLKQPKTTINFLNLHIVPISLFSHLGVTKEKEGKKFHLSELYFFGAWLKLF